MRLLILGDVVGRTARKVACNALPRLKEQYALDFIIVNGENAAGGFGINETIFNQFINAGADVVTTGNHVWDQRETLVFIDRYPALLRPLNFPAGTPGKGSGLFPTKSGPQILVLHAMGRVFMQELDCPFQEIAKQVEACPMGEMADIIILDFHGEATSEKQAMAHYLDGKVSLVVGTHTHVPTADDHILPGGTGYISDLGMCGNYDSVLGMDKEEPVQRFVSRINRARFTPVNEDPITLSGICADIDDKTGLTTALSPIRIGGHLREIRPEFWDKSIN